MFQLTQSRSYLKASICEALVFLIEQPTVPSNNALVTDACAAALRASYSAAQRGRSVARSQP